MIRVLQVVNIMDRAGLETMLMNYYRNIDREKIQFDFLTHRKEKGAYDDEIEKLGGKVYHAPRLYPQNYLKYFRWMQDFFLEHPEYRIVHSHIDSMSYLPLLAAKKAGIPIRIAHSHNTKIPMDFKYPLKQYFRMKINIVCNYRLACGKEAGNHLFGGHDFSIIPNAIMPDAFYFNENVRLKKREELKIKDKFVIGHVGRFSRQKNHSFLIRIFSELVKMRPNALLLLVGEGEIKDKIERQVMELGLKNNVVFLGNRSDVNELYQAMDVFVMPSIFEGLPVVGVEAQANGLPCLFSDTISSEVLLTNQAEMMSLKCHPKEWADKVMNMRREKGEDARTQLAEKGYDIQIEAQKLQEGYVQMYIKK